MLSVASILAHIGLGIVLALFFVIYYVNGEGKIKLYLEIFLGLGGNAGAIFVLYKTFNITDTTVNLLSIAACLFAFIISVIIFVAIFAHLIKDKENSNNQIIRTRDIIVGQTAWIKEFRDKRMREIDDNLNYEKLKQRETLIKCQENEIEVKNKLLEDEIENFNKTKATKVCMILPENHRIIISKEFVELMPSYFKDVVRCIIEINALEKEYLENTTDFDMNWLKSYLFAIATSISSNIFNNNSGDIRIHFRYFDKTKNGYDKLIAIKGSQLFTQKMTFIPYEEDNMIIKSYESKRALIKSINITTVFVFSILVMFLSLKYFTNL